MSPLVQDALPTPSAPTLNLNVVAEEGCQGDCCPLTMRDKLSIFGGSGVLFLIILMLLRTAMVSALVRKDWSPVLASHAALSVSIFFGGVATVVIANVVKGCWLPSYFLLAAVLGGVWFLHLIFTLIAVRK